MQCMHIMPIPTPSLLTRVCSFVIQSKLESALVPGVTCCCTLWLAAFPDEGCLHGLCLGSRLALP
jgi:hypothetical protein